MLCFSLSLLLLEKNPVFPPKKGIFVYFFCVSLCFSLALFHFLLFLCLSLSLLACFLPFCFFHFCFWFFLFLFVLFTFVVLWFLLFCLLSCFVLNHNLSVVFALHLLSSFCSCFLFCLLWFFVFFDFGKPNKNIFKKNGN